MVNKETQPHAHRWIFETPQGVTSRGVCKTCGDVTRLKNYLEPESDGRFSKAIRPKNGTDFSFVTHINN